MKDVYGLDFGTTNSLAALVVDGRAEALFDADERPHPSMVASLGGAMLVGADLKQRLGGYESDPYIDVERSPKRRLDEGDTVYLGGRDRPVEELILPVMEHLAGHAADEDFPPMGRAVVTVPISMRGPARRRLRKAAGRAGIDVVQFVHEPLAALYGHLRSFDDHRRRLRELSGRLLLVADWGGGTLDLTLCTLLDGRLVQVHSVGDETIGGDRFDDRLVQLVRARHFAEHGLDENARPLPGAHAKLVERCERAKIALSQRHEQIIFLGNYLDVAGPAAALEVRITRDDLVAAVADLIDAGMARIDQLLDRVGRPAGAVALCVPTGGITEMPEVRRRLRERFDAARLSVPERGDAAIALGAAWIAHDDLQVVLAKSLEVMHADDAFHPIVDAGTVIPRRDEIATYPLDMYCTDPRDGHAHFQLARAIWPGRDAPTDPRLLHGSLRTRVDERARPLRERLRVEVRLDRDAIATVHATASLTGHHGALEIHDLEFGLNVDRRSAWGPPVGRAAAEVSDYAAVRAERHDPGEVRLRGKVVSDQKAWGLVPGETVRDQKPDWRLNSRQRDEYDYYLLCAVCGRSASAIKADGCQDERCRVPPAAGEGRQSAPPTPA